MRFQIWVVPITIMLVFMLSGCGVGGGIIPNGSGSAQVGASTYWGSPGGNPANTRLSTQVGPQTNEVAWTTIGENFTSTGAVITPDGTIVVGVGYAVIGFNPDGSVRWKNPVVNRVYRVFISDDGTICYQYDWGDIRLVAQDGTLLLKYEHEYMGSYLLGFGPQSTMYFRAFAEDYSDVLVSVSSQGEVLFEIPFDRYTYYILTLPNNVAANATGLSGLVVWSEDGTTLWSDKLKDAWMGTSWVGPGNTIYVSVRTDSEYLKHGYVTYDLDGNRTELIKPEFYGNDFEMEGVTSTGATIWINWREDTVAYVDPSGDILWKHTTDFRLVNQLIAFGNNGEVYVRTHTGELSEYTMQWLGFNAAGDLFQSIGYGRNSFSIFPLVVGELGQVYFGDNDAFSAYEPGGDLAWSFVLGGNIGSIASAPDGTIYSTAGTVLIATSPAGDELWRYAGPDYLLDVLVGVEGNIYTHTIREILQLSSSGHLMAQIEFPNAPLQTISLSPDGHLYSADFSRTIKAFLPTLIPSWESRTGELVTTRIAIGDDGTLYFGCRDGMLYAVDLAGNTVWTFDVQSNYPRTPLLTRDAIFVSSLEGGLFKLGLDGSQLWRFETPGYCYASPSIGPDGTVYIGTSGLDPNSGVLPLGELPSVPVSGYVMKLEALQNLGQTENDPVLLDLLGEGMGLFALGQNGTTKWNLHTSIGVTHPVCVDGAGSIYLGISGQLFSLNPDGTERWRYSSDKSGNTAPMIGGRGSIILGAETHLVSIGSGL